MFTFWSAIFVKSDKSKEAVAEIKCPACDGTGFSKVKQPAEPGHRIYPAPCKECAGKGRIALARS
jgi:DnaJ-class molecular chaperone